jgi:hypothetical protein
MQKYLHILEEQTPKTNKKNCCQRTAFKMTAKFKMATKSKFAYKTYKSSFFKKKIRAVFAEIPKFYRKKKSQKFKMASKFNMENFLVSFFSSSHIRQEF